MRILILIFPRLSRGPKIAPERQIFSKNTIRIGKISPISYLHQCRGLAQRCSLDRAPETHSGPGTNMFLSSRPHCTRWTSGTPQSTDRCPASKVEHSRAEIHMFRISYAIKTQLFCVFMGRSFHWRRHTFDIWYFDNNQGSCNYRAFGYILHFLL